MLVTLVFKEAARHLFHGVKQGYCFDAVLPAESET